MAIEILDSRMSSGATSKAFISQVLAAARTSQGLTPTIHGTDCSRFWIQGLVVVVSPDRATYTIDDGTGAIPIDVTTFRKSIPASMGQEVTVGDLVMIIGPLFRRATTATASISPSDPDAEGVPMILAHQVMVLSKHPQQDTIWFLEVVEYWGARMR